MTHTTINITVEIKEETEMNEQEKALVEAAKQATRRSYAPYSHFSVGAAVELDDGTIVCGSNQENAAYPSGTCAERTAVFYANAQYPDTGVKRICIAARDTSGMFTSRPVPPCGACRQVLLETEARAGHDVEMILYSTDRLYVVKSVKSLLPLSFDDAFLRQK